jgi:SAM-dependent methyltransferase
MSAALPGSYFDALYSRRDDPWRFESRWYERRKRAITMASLPRERYDSALEIGCSLGLLTVDLAERCESVLALDIAKAAVDAARARTAGLRVRVEQADVAEGLPEGVFDLVVLSEVGYYFASEGLARLLDEIEGRLAANGTLVACHWRHPVDDYPLSGDAVHAAIDHLGLTRVTSHLEDDFVLEVWTRDGTSVAARTGML